MGEVSLEKLLQSKKYRDVCPDTVRRVWGECTKKYKKPKDVDKAAREALHGITGAFLTPAEAREIAWAMQAWAVGGRTDAQLENVLNKHASTRERLPIPEMDALYARIFEITGKTDRVLDLACGINPIYLGARGIKATGVDISQTVVGFINTFRDSYGMPVEAICADLLCPDAIPRERFDVALLFKALPLLERQRSGAAADVMGAIDAKYIVASFPTRTLGGRNVGMAAHYAEWMAGHLPRDRAVAGRFETGNELFYILKEI
ncbi:MAG: Rmt family 16S rRNA (guanine(1405)-N(7))-methyltransferase [Clostridia bacterium]|nr:Rmt family 16S rRNA (guanine(1405)-N(7))-methyltransferase [Clostridia bacterium]